AEGLIVGDTVRCPWHHACFSLRTGEALRAPALSPVACWSTEFRDGKVYVREKVTTAKRKLVTVGAGLAKRIVMIGGGAAGFAAIEMLRRQGFDGDITMLSDDDAPPVDRPNLSKDYLAGTAPEEWVPLRDEGFYTQHGIDLRLKTKVAAIDVSARRVVLDGGDNVPFDRLLLNHQSRRDGTTRGRHRRELHRSRSRRIAARAWTRGARRGAGQTADGA